MKGRFPCTLLVAVLATFGATLAHALSGGPDGFGYTYADSTEPDGPVFDFMDISATGSPLVLTDDEMSGPNPVGFTFNFYGIDYTDVYVSSNGFLSFLSGQSDGCCDGQDFPMPGDPDAVIAASWGDFNPNPNPPDFGGGSIYTQTLGTAPNRVFIVQFTDVPMFSFNVNPPVTTHQYQLFEGLDIIEVHYLELPRSGYTAGIENETGDVGLYYAEDIELELPVAVQYRPPNQNPDCTAAVPSIKLLWPPNHKYRSVRVLGVTDPDGTPVSITIDSIFQDEPLNSFGDGNTSPDGRGVGTAIAQVRAERSGTKKVPGNGRFYHINFTADDGNNGRCSGEVSVIVPHDRGRKGRNPIDGGPIYDSTFSK